jgi:membrane-bound metal-dependent hydrolase YbcI (DUF457 family)
MANFKTHISFGIILGIICTASAMIFNIFSDWLILITILVAISIGSFLPDIDSDSSTPFKIVFYTLATICSFLSLHWMIEQYPNQWLLIMTIPILIFIIIRFLIGYIFKKFTHHRGIFHSIPMAILMSLSILVFLKIFSELSPNHQLIISIAVGIGFISHLILDELYSLININGEKFYPNKNLGSALKLWSNSIPITLLVYSLIFILLYILFNYL